MAAPARRGPDIRRIRSSICYSISEIAELLEVHQNTVRRWLNSGLPTIDTTRPVLVHGADLRAFIIRQRKARRHRCANDQLYCCRCRRPRRPQKGSVKLEIQNRRTLLIKGRCQDCGAPMNRAGSADEADAHRQAFEAMMSLS